MQVLYLLLQELRPPLCAVGIGCNRADDLSKFLNRRRQRIKAALKSLLLLLYSSELLSQGRTVRCCCRELVPEKTKPM
jgi:hypothetical protein